MIRRQRLDREHVERRLGDLRRSCSAAISAGSSTTAPREALISLAPRGSSDSRRASSRPRVSGVSGSITTRISVSARKASSASRPALHATPSIVFALRLQPRTSKPRPGQCLRRRRAELAQTEHADLDVRQRARMNVVPFAASLRALEDRDIARIADDREQHVARHQRHHAGIRQARDRHVGQVVAADQRIDAGAEIGHQRQIGKSREEPRRRLPDQRIAHVGGIAGRRIGAEIEVRQFRRQRPVPGLGIVELAVENQCVAAHALCRLLEQPRHRGDRKLVAERPEAGDDSGRRLRDEGMMAEWLAPVDVAHVHFDDRLLEREQRVEDRDRRVGQAGAIDDEPVGIAAAPPGSSRSARPRGWTGGNRARRRGFRHACGSAPRSAGSFRCHRSPWHRVRRGWRSGR